MATQVFTAVTRPLNGLDIECTARGKSFVLDEPPALGGTDVGMNPVEALLSALGACKCIVAKAFADARGIKLTDIEIQLDGDLDPDGFLGKNPDAKIGFSRIVTKYAIKADNTEGEIMAFIDFIEHTCPVKDTLVNPAVMEAEVSIG